MAEIASGSIDLKTVKNAHDDATKYITKIDDAGISIHPYNDSTGISITKNRAVVTSDGMEIYKNNVSVASFGTVARIGSTASGFTRTEITSKGMQISYNNSGADEYIATFGYGDGNSVSGTAIYAPYYTLGLRGTTTTPYDSDSTYGVGDLCIYDDKEWVCITVIDTAEAWNATHWMRSVGNYSHAEGWNTVASGHSAHTEGRNAIAIGNYSHAEGFKTIASGNQSHAEGSNSTAIGFQSHAEGYDTVASGDYSHAEGIWSVASGDRSHAQNYMTIAASDSQTAIGKYNVEDATDTYAFIIGKGSSARRSNALTVDWNGNVDIASGAKYKINGIDLAPTDIFCIEERQSFTACGKEWVFRRIGDIVFLDAPADITSASAGLNTIGTLPETMRPGYTQRVSLGNNANAGKFVQIDPNGLVRYYTNTAVTAAQNGAVSTCFIVGI